MGQFTSEEYIKVIGGKNSKGMSNPAWLLTKNVRWFQSDSKPVTITVIQIYSSTTDGEEIEVEQFCGKLQQFVDTRSKKDIKLEWYSWK